MLTYITYITHHNLPGLILNLSNLSVLGAGFLVIVALVHKGKSSRFFWPVVYCFTVLNVVAWSFTLTPL